MTSKTSPGTIVERTLSNGARVEIRAPTARDKRRLGAVAVDNPRVGTTEKTALYFEKLIELCVESVSKFDTPMGKVDSVKTFLDRVEDGELFFELGLKVHDLMGLTPKEQDFLSDAPSSVPEGGA